MLQVPLGVQLKNEIKNQDMIDVLANLQQYVPVKSVEDEIVDSCNGEVVKIVADEFHYVLFGGDQLTAERATGAKRSINNENRGYDRLEGLVPVIEDWHAKVCFLKVSSIIVINDVNNSIGYMKNIVQYIIWNQSWHTIPTS